MDPKLNFVCSYLFNQTSNAVPVSLGNYIVNRENNYVFFAAITLGVVGEILV
jgi:hypothetical protein